MDEDKIDRCFVNEDANGIYEILDKTESNADLSGWNKLRIINEGRSALFDLRMERRLKLYQKQKAFSEAIRERGAVSREQFEKRLRELAGKMEEQ